MFKSYFLLGVRSLLKNKSYVIINTLGLGIALACCITAYIIVAYNIEFDRFHEDEKVENIFKIHTHVRERDGKITQRVAAPMVMGPIVSEEIAGIEKFTRFISDGGYMRYGEKAFGEGFNFADSTFFEMFDFPLLQGSHRNFKNRHSIFISNKLAVKYFGNEDPIGKTMVLNFANEKEVEVMVGGVVDKMPVNNTFVFDALVRIEHYMAIHDMKADSWEGWQHPSTFLQLSSPELATSISKQLVKYATHLNEVKKDLTVDQFKLEAFKAPEFNQSNIPWSYVNARMDNVTIIVFTSMASLILLIACFNLTNTSIAMTAQRLKEVGVRKSIGASRFHIISQFLLETLLTILLSLIVGIFVAQLIVPVFTEMWNLPYGMEDLSGLNLFIALLLLVVGASLIAGIYPALFNSKFKPVVLLKGNVTIKGTNAFTRMLVALQFALSVIMLIAGVVFIQNAKFQEQLQFGYDADMVITVQIQSEKEFSIMRDHIATNPKILKIAVCDHQVGYSTYPSPVKVDTSEYQVQHIGVGKNYFETMGFTFAQGRAFDPEVASDLNETLIVNKAFLEKAGIEDPIDKIVVVHESKRRIVGVLENHIDNLYRSKTAEPFVFYPAVPIAYKLLLVRVNPADRIEVQQYLEKSLKKFFPTKAFESQLQEDIVLRNTKRVNGNLKKIFLFLTILGGLLSASGIFSLASLNIAKRTKEIGVRKALGASAKNIVMLLNKEFVIILTVAGVVGATGGYYMISWLLGEIYAYHVDVSITPIILCGLTIFGIGVFTTSATILKAAQANPVDTLRSE